MAFFTRHARVSVDEKKIDELLFRGVAEAIVKEQLRKELLSGRRLRVKLGIDPTSPNLHLGRAVSLLKLRDFQELGHQVVFILGDFTAVIGDTSDKDAERPMLSREEIEHNEHTYKAQVGKLIDLSRAEFRHNSEWLESLRYRDIGEQADLFSVADFTARENIKRRLEAGKRVSLREVLYPLMQGYDSVATRADVELGGTDQKFNLLAGRVIQERHAQKPQNILMNPLIEGLDGRKMSSSWGNVVAIDASPADMYGKIMSMQDTHIGNYFELCTRIPIREVVEIRENLNAGTLHPKEAKMRLAKEIASLYHGKEAAEKAERSWVDTFSKGGMPSEALSISVSRGALLSDAIATTGMSKSEFRRLLEAGAVSEIGGAPISDLNFSVTRSLNIRIGKHRFYKVELI
ncbi:MAG: tyrosine--tRNA ligase [Patescibacteria group bacterium]|nr:tyrosine--tRNA ligase [Patescibacteria group bacterium]